jgi:cytidylate kinase|tara:strand:+ start:11063 stop:11698 length:636 start_codon:yes stop_codon:yes gene_type:complete
MTASLIIAVDGPAASGKGTIAKALARHYSLPHLDTGALYRAVAVAVIADGCDPANAGRAAALAENFPDSLLADPQLRSRQAGALASVVSAHPEVRAALLQRQRHFAAQPGGAVLDGRDVGTVIAPDATAKLFVTADVAERARRRTLELTGRGEPSDQAAILADLEARDARDSSRASAPLKVAPDAVVIDTTGLGIEDAIAAAIAAVDKAIG